MLECHGSLQEVTSGNKLLPLRILEGYAKAKLNDSKIKAAVPNFVQIQHNIVDSFTNIIRFEIENRLYLYSHGPARRNKKTARWAVSCSLYLGLLNARKPP
jgi:hypothetical protein